jgi:hypothetical protein
VNLLNREPWFCILHASQSVTWLILSAEKEGEAFGETTMAIFVVL